MVCIVPRGHELAQQPSVSIAALAAYPLIAHHPSIPFGQLVSAAFRKAGVTLASRIDIHQTDVACSLVRAGAGVAMVDQFTVAGVAWDDLQVLPLADEIRLTPSIVRHPHGCRVAGCAPGGINTKLYPIPETALAMVHAGS
jgi:DNA-binding transcriptional LysR family regulator